MPKKIYKGANNWIVAKQQPTDDLNNEEEELAMLEKQKKHERRVPEIASKLGYLAHHFFPDRFRPHRVPDFLAFPTHIHREQKEYVVSASAGKMIIYFSPALSVQAPDPGSPVTASPTAGQYLYSDAANYIYFAYAGPASVTNAMTFYAINAFFNNPTTTPTANWDRTETGLDNGSSIKMTRLLSARMKISYLGKPLEASGNIRAALSLLKYGSTLVGQDVSTSLVAAPVYQSFDADEEISLSYRIVDDTFFNMGPYHSNTSFPYFLVFGENLSTTGSYKVTIERYFESIVAANMVEITNPQKEEASSIGITKIKDHYGVFDVDPILRVSEYEALKHKFSGA